MAAPHGREWIGVFVALSVVCYGLMFIDNVKTSSEVWEYFTDILLAIALSGIATMTWISWSYLRRYDIPGHEDKED